MSDRGNGTREGVSRPIPTAPPGYELRELLGRGAVGEVWRASATDSLARDFAIKIIPEAHDWEREFASLRRVEALRAASGSRDLVETFLAAELGGRGYVVMEFLAGGDLWRLVRDSGPLAAAEAVRLLVPVARALALLHTEGLVHKDVKPSNVLLDREGRPRLADFGLVRFASDPLSRAGTPGFCAPEVYSGGPLPTDPRLDVYSFGATLHCLLTGKAPPPGRPDLWELERLDVDRELQRFLVDLLLPDPGQRPSDAVAVLRWLERWQAEDAGSSAQGSGRIHARWRRLWAVLGAGAMCAVLAALWARGGPSARSAAVATVDSSAPSDAPLSLSGASGQHEAEPGRGVVPPSGSGGAAGARRAEIAPQGTNAVPATLLAPRASPAGPPRWDGRELWVAGPAVLWRGGEARRKGFSGVPCLDEEPMAVARDSSGRVVAAATKSGQAVALEVVPQGLRVRTVLPPVEVPPLLVRVATDGRRMGRLLVFASGPDRVEVWDLSAPRSLMRFSVPPSSALALLPDGRGVVLGGLDGRLRIHDSERVVATLPSHGDSVLALSPGPSCIHALGDDRELHDGVLAPRPKLVVRTYSLADLLTGRSSPLGEAPPEDWTPPR